MMVAITRKITIPRYSLCSSLSCMSSHFPWTRENLCRDPGLDTFSLSEYSSAVLNLSALVWRIPEGYSQGSFRYARWSVSKTVHSGGRSVKLYAEELGGSDFVSCNFYQTSAGWSAKPCEMPLEKVEEFLREFALH